MGENMGEKMEEGMGERMKRNATTGYRSVRCHSVNVAFVSGLSINGEEYYIRLHITKISGTPTGVHVSHAHNTDYGTFSPASHAVDRPAPPP